MPKHSRTLSNSSFLTSDLDEFYNTSVTFDASELQQTVTNIESKLLMFLEWALIGLLLVYPWIIWSFQ